MLAQPAPQRGLRLGRVLLGPRHEPLQGVGELLRFHDPDLRRRTGDGDHLTTTILPPGVATQTSRPTLAIPVTPGSGSATWPRRRPELGVEPHEPVAAGGVAGDTDRPEHVAVRDRVPDLAGQRLPPQRRARSPGRAARSGSSPTTVSVPAGPEQVRRCRSRARVPSLTARPRERVELAQAAAEREHPQAVALGHGAARRLAERHEAVGDVAARDRPAAPRWRRRPTPRRRRPAARAARSHHPPEPASGSARRRGSWPGRCAAAAPAPCRRRTAGRRRAPTRRPRPSATTRFAVHRDPRDDAPRGGIDAQDLAADRIRRPDRAKARRQRRKGRGHGVDADHLRGGGLGLAAQRQRAERDDEREQRPPPAPRPPAPGRAG